LKLGGLVGVRREAGGGKQDDGSEASDFHGSLFLRDASRKLQGHYTRSCLFEMPRFSPPARPAASAAV
jgi:hypothetical protein